MDTSLSNHRRRSSSLSFISTGTAKVKSMDKLTATITTVPKHMSSSPSADIGEFHRLPSPDIPVLETLPECIEEHEDDRHNAVPSQLSNRQRASPQLEDFTQEQTHYMQRAGHREERTEQEKRRSIIDPSSIRLSFAGSVTSLESPLLLEEGFQKLYHLYQQNTPQAPHLPHSVSITEIPLMTIAESIETQIKQQATALEECADNIAALNHTTTRAKQDMISLELQYSLARQEANMRAMTPNDVLLRLTWLKEEISRLNTDKEHLIRQTAESEYERDRLRKELIDMLELRQENQKLKQTSLQQEQKHKEMRKQLDEANEKLASLRFTVQNVPSPIRKICTKILVPSGEKQQQQQQQQENVKIQKHKRTSSMFSFY